MKPKQFMLVAGLVLLSFCAQAQVTQASNTVTTGSYVGTSNAQPLVFKQENVFSGMISPYYTSLGVNSGSAYQSVFVGANAGTSYNLSGNTNNVFVGFNSGKVNTSGYSNTFIGALSGQANLVSKSNVFVGIETGKNHLIGDSNVFIGDRSGMNSTDGYDNVFIGRETGTSTTGYQNTFLGTYSGHFNSGGIGNCFVGNASGQNNVSGNYNTAIGNFAGTSIKSGIYNTVIGFDSGNNLITGDRNTFIGFVSLNNNLANPSSTGTDTSNTIILADGAGNQRLFLDGLNSINGVNYNGFAGIGLGNNVRPQNRLEIGAGIANTSGLRFRGLNNTSTSTTNTTNKILSVNASGDVILVDDKQSSVASPLTTIVGSTGVTSVLTGTQYTLSSPNQTLSISGNNLSLTNNGGAATTVTLPTSTTSIIAGTNTTVTGDGTVTTPYVISATGGADTSIYANDGVLTGDRTVTMGDKNLFFNTSTNSRIYIGQTTPLYPTTTGDYRLYVEGGVLTEKVKVALRSSINWADYVFAKDYKLTPLKEVAKFIDGNQHLPGVAPATELVKNGLDLGAMQAIQMAKIEELTLYAIEQDKNLDKQAKEIEELKAQVKSLIEKNK